MNSEFDPLLWLRGLVGAALGGVAGAFFFGLALKSGFYIVALPGTLLGLGCGFLSGGKSQPLGLVCGILGLGLGIFCEWHEMPFVADTSLSFFLRHLHLLSGVKLFMLALGGAFAYWFGMGRQN
ncbi:MAG: hypothetical protein KDA42_09390 [Planctomycetales bacterium]|nr:hypothetical protein [Planctomycetales bacterium]